MNKGMIYKCTMTSGGGTEYDYGIWSIKTLTEKTLALELVKDSFYSVDEKKIRCRIDQGGNRHALINHNDGTFTVYLNKNGKPYYFEPIKTNLLFNK